MTIEIKVPVFPESVTDGTLVSWKKKEGDSVQRDEVIAEIETDKVVFEVPAIEDGVLSKITVNVDELVVSGQVIGEMEAGSQAESSKIPEPSVLEAGDEQVISQAGVVQQASGDGIVHSTVKPTLGPAAEKAVVENKLDPGALKGTGKDGRILKEDVIAHVNKTSSSSPTSNNPQAGQAKPSKVNSPAKNTNVNKQSVIESPVSTSNNMREEKRVPMTRLRARIAERLLESQQTAAILTTFNEINMQAIIELRAKYRDKFEKAHQVKLGFMSFFVKATVEALKRFPDVNACIDGNDILYHGYQDLGIAVGSPRGLVVPVLRDADQMDFADIERGIVDFGARAQTGSLTLEEMTGGTFSITNGGVFGSLLSTPIINPPQSAILGLHKIEKRAVVENDQVVVRPMMYVALSYDHRLIDGRGAVQFLVAIKDQIEDPARLLLGV